ncbi:MAG TPA: serine hydrolase domain-containing protein [Thermoanaerobaculia bacterium]|jgi:hypothetical protein
MFRALPLLLLLTACASSPVARLLDRYEQYGFSGAVYATDGARLLVDDAYGRGNTRRTGFEVGSVTKTFTARAVLLLESRGKLRVDDPIARYIGAVPPDKETITLRHLLTHTSGLVPNVWDAAVAKNATRDEMLAAVKASKLLFAPGARTRYSNTGFTVLAAIIELVSGEPYETFIRREVIAPGGLRETGFADDDLWPQRARGIAEPDDEVSGPQQPGPRSWGSHRGAGGIVSTAADLHRWLIAAHPVQSPLGWFSEKTNLGRAIVYHDGHIPGFRANAIAFAERPLLVAYAINDERFKMPVGEAVERIVFGDRVLVPPRPRRFAPLEPSRITGTYAAGDARIIVRIDNGLLVAGALGQHAIDLLMNGGRELPGARATTERTRATLERLARGEADAELAQWWRAQCGDRAAELRGTAPRSPVLLQTFVTCGDTVLRFVWRGDQLAGQGGGVPAAGTVALRQYDAHAFVAFENLLATEVAKLTFGDGTLTTAGETLRRVSEDER